MTKSPKKVKKVTYNLVIEKWVMHNLDFLTLLLNSNDGSDSEVTSEDEDPHTVACA